MLVIHAKNDSQRDRAFNGKFERELRAALGILIRGEEGDNWVAAHGLRELGPVLHHKNDRINHAHYKAGEKAHRNKGRNRYHKGAKQ